MRVSNDEPWSIQICVSFSSRTLKCPVFVVPEDHNLWGFAVYETVFALHHLKPPTPTPLNPSKSANHVLTRPRHSPI